MPKNVLFYASVDGDRKFGAEDFKMWLGPFFTTGVFNGGLQITANGSMVLTMGPGHANYQFGPVVEYDAPEAIAVPPAGSLPRIDRIVMRRDDPARDVYYHYLQGAGSSNPVPPEITRVNGVHDLVLAQFPVNPGTVGITPDIVSDKREDPDLCGYVAATVKEIDFSGMWEQWEAMAEQMENALNGVIDGSQYMLQAGFNPDGTPARQVAFKEYPDELETVDKSVPGAINELFRGASGWITGDLIPAAGVTGSSYKYKFNAMLGILHLYGAGTKSAGWTSGNTIAALPEIPGFTIPSSPYPFSAGGYVGSSTTGFSDPAIAILTLNPNGTITVGNNIGATRIYMNISATCYIDPT